MENISFDDIKEILRENAIGMAELRKSQQEVREMFKETDAKFKETSAEIKELAKQLGGIGNSNGFFAEQFFAQSLTNKKSLGGIKFDEIETNLKHKRKGLTDEFDIVMYNGDSIAIVEVKYIAAASHLANLLDKKATNFKYLYPEYAGYKIYLGLAGLSFENNQVKEMAIAAGVAVLEAKGDHAEIIADNMKAY